MTATGPTLPFALDEYAGRLRRVRDAAAPAGVDVLVVTDPKNVCYLTGHDSSCTRCGSRAAATRSPRPRG